MDFIWVNMTVTVRQNAYGRSQTLSFVPRIDKGSMQVGTMTAFITYAMMIVMSFLMLSAMSIMLPRAGVAAERIDEVIRTRKRPSCFARAKIPAW